MEARHGLLTLLLLLVNAAIFAAMWAQAVPTRALPPAAPTSFTVRVAAVAKLGSVAALRDEETLTREPNEAATEASPPAATAPLPKDAEALAAAIDAAASLTQTVVDGNAADVAVSLPTTDTKLPLRFDDPRLAFGRSVSPPRTSALHEWLSVQPKGVADAPPKWARFLQTELFYNKYGLTNVLMSAAAMMAYAALDDRAVVLPEHPANSPVDMERLLDVKATQAALLDLGVVLVTRDEQQRMNYSVVPMTRARQRGVRFGDRVRIGSSDIGVAEGQLGQFGAIMRHTARFPRFMQRNFFLNFPFRATAPVDLCFMLRRLVFHERVRQQSAAVLTAVAAARKNWTLSPTTAAVRDDASPAAPKRGGALRLLAVHLRMEGDAFLVLREAAHVQTATARRWFEEQILPLARRTDCNAIYVCAGKLAPDLIAALKMLPMPLYFKTDFPDIGVRMQDAHLKQVTSHEGAAVDVLVLQAATVAVTCEPSTLTYATLSRRCPTPARNTTMARGKPQSLRFPVFGHGVSVKPDPGELIRPDEASMRPDAGWAAWGAPRPFEGVVGYGIDHEAKFTPLRYIPCDTHFKQCYYDRSW